MDENMFIGIHVNGASEQNMNGSNYLHSLFMPSNSQHETHFNLCIYAMSKKQLLIKVII